MCNVLCESVGCRVGCRWAACSMGRRQAASGKRGRDRSIDLRTIRSMIYLFSLIK